MAHRAVLLELLAVIGREQDPGPHRAPSGGDPLEQPADLIVHESDLAVVPIDEEAPVFLGQGDQGILEAGDRIVGGVERPGIGAGEEGPVGRRGVVRPVRIEVVHEEKERPASLRAHPRQRRVGHAVRGRLHARLETVAGARQPEVLEALEAAVEAEGGGDVDVGHEASRGVARGAQRLGHRRDLRRQPQPVVLHPVVRGIARGHDRHDRRQGPGGGGPGALERGAAPGEVVDVRRGGTVVAVGAEMVGAQGVHDDQHDVGMGGVEAGAPAARGLERGEQRQDQ